ncbi:caspase domain-containing protein [Phycomyces nitens]|nr:caspase domain-containing protein [Phycomyces nitens]
MTENYYSTYTRTEYPPSEGYSNYSEETHEESEDGTQTYHYTKTYTTSTNYTTSEASYSYGVPVGGHGRLHNGYSAPLDTEEEEEEDPEANSRPTLQSSEDSLARYHSEHKSSGDDVFLHVRHDMKNKAPPSFELSNCQGKKRALLIGINYTGTPNELKGCINDVHNVKNFLTTLYGFQEEDMVILTDDQEEPQLIPTRANILAAMEWLVHDANPNDSFFFHYSGHGGSVKDISGDEDDGFDETIYPVDFQEFDGESGQIIDDDMHDIMVKPLCAGCRLTAIFDSCHSATALDLPYIYSTHGVIKEMNLFKDAGKGLLTAGVAYLQGDKMGAFSSMKDTAMRLFNARDVGEQNRQTNSSPADVIMFSGCKDDQTSADSQEAGKATGAMSFAFTSTLRENPNQSYHMLLNSVRDILRNKYEQRPQMSSSHPIDVNLMFVC